MDIIFFILVSLGIIVVPGPNILVVISTGISHGRVRAFQTVAGISVAMAVQLFVAALGTTYIVSILVKGFIWLKWAGVLYLIYLGIKHLVTAFSPNHSQPGISAIGSFQRGFWVSLTNPKTILFFSAFLPQFTTQSYSYMSQIALLSGLFWGMALFVNCMYTILSSGLVSLVSSNRLVKYQNGASGVIYCSAGFFLAGTKST